MLQQNKKIGWLIVLVLIFSFISATHAQDSLKIKLDKKGEKFLLLKGYLVQKDTLIARTADGEKFVAKIYAKCEELLDTNDILKDQLSKRYEQQELFKNIIRRKDYIIGQQYSLIIQLEKIAKPPHPIVKFFRNIFKPEVTLILGFIAGVYAGVSVD